MRAAQLTRRKQHAVATGPLVGFAHSMGCAAIGRDAGDGVCNDKGEVFGYKNLRVLDASIIPRNLAVNPSLTILALSEHAMSHVPELPGDKPQPVRFSRPLPGSVSMLAGHDDLLAQTVNIYRNGSP